MLETTLQTDTAQHDVQQTTLRDEQVGKGLKLLCRETQRFVTSRVIMAPPGVWWILHLQVMSSRWRRAARHDSSDILQEQIPRAVSVRRSTASFS